MKWVNLLNLVLNVIEVDNKDIRMTSTCFFIINFEHVIAFILARWFGLSNKGLSFTNVIRCSRLRPWVGYFICFKFTPVSLIVYQSLHP